MFGFIKIICHCLLLAIATNAFGEARTTSEMSKQYEGFFHEISPDTIMNVDGGYIQTKLIVKVSKPEAARKLKIVKQFSPLILDSIIDSLNVSPKNHLSTRNGRKSFRKEASEAVNEALKKEIGAAII